MLSVKMAGSFTQSIFQPEVDVDSAELVQTLDDKSIN